MIVVTGATGQLGRLVIAALLERGIAAQQIVAAVRSPEKAADLTAQGITVRRADYNDAPSLDTAFAGAQKVLLISGNELGQRLKQHQAVIDAAGRANVALFAYTSLLHANRRAISLADEHVATEQAIAAAKLPAVVLRNGWYTENFAMRIASAVEQGVIYGCAGDGRVAAAARADYAAAAAAVLTSDTPLDALAGSIFELAGDTDFSLGELASAVSAASGKPARYQDVEPQAYQAALQEHGVPEPIAAMLASADVGSRRGALTGASDDLAKLIGRPTTPLAMTLSSLLAV